MSDNGKESGAPSGSFHISRENEIIEGTIDGVLRAWVERFPDEVERFAAQMLNWKENVKRAPFTGAVKGTDECGRHLFSIDMEIPSTVWSLMAHCFGHNWIKEKPVYKAFKNRFILGKLNPGKSSVGTVRK